jgi:hypothetical protein
MSKSVPHIRAVATYKVHTQVGEWQDNAIQIALDFIKRFTFTFRELTKKFHSSYILTIRCYATGVDYAHLIFKRIL